jgi:hypothetical protein
MQWKTPVLDLVKLRTPGAVGDKVIANRHHATLTQLIAVNNTSFDVSQKSHKFLLPFSFYEVILRVQNPQ